jgi:transposase
MNMARIPNEIRALIVKHMEDGKEKKDIANWLSVCVRTVTRVWRKYQATGDYKSSPNKGGRKPRVTETEMQHVVAKIEEQPDITLLELIETFNLNISQSALCRRLIKLDLTFKKRLSIPKGKSGTTL